MNIYALNTISVNKPHFCGTKGVVSDAKGISNVKSNLVIETHFMRDLNTTNFVVDYIKKNFPNGTHIADYGCSQGYETYTFGTLLNDSNTDKRYKITGYDLSPSNIEAAKKGDFIIGEGFNRHENFLTKPHMALTPAQKEIRTQFKHCFTKSPKEKNHFTPNESAFKDIISFETSDIFNVQQTLSDKQTGVIIFKNALYHLIQKTPPEIYFLDNGSIEVYNNPIDSVKDLNSIESLFKKINFVLRENDIFVLGSLHSDHFLDLRDMYKTTRKMYQNNMLININDQSPIHNLLRNAGFEPIFYDKYKQASDDIQGISSVPSVWKKVKNAI